MAITSDRSFSLPKPVACATPPVIGKGVHNRAGDWKLRWSLFVAAIGLGSILFLFDPERYGFYPRCLLHQTTGLLCPGCGSLRALHQLLHGHVAAALHFNALLVLSIPFAVWLAGRWTVNGRRHIFELINWRPVWLGTAAGLVIAFGILRNLPFAQKLWLAPF